MRYYFFKTVEIGGEKRLRALPGQTFPDGKPVDGSETNVRAPKDQGSSPNGSRLDYPTGTVFCSSHLEEVTRGNDRPFYTVYPGGLENNSTPDFHPVGLTTYLKPAHRSKTMEMAYASFLITGDQEFGQEEKSDGPSPAKRTMTYGARRSPSDSKGNANPPEQGWSEAYPDQKDTEWNLLSLWMRKTLREMAIEHMMARPKIDPAISGLLNTLYQSGETVDSIANRSRFEKKMTEEGLTPGDFEMMSGGPFAWYLERLADEHKTGAECTAVDRDPDNPAQVDEAAFILNAEIGNRTGMSESHNAPDTLHNIKESLKAGWTLDTMIEHSSRTGQNSARGLSDQMARGLIPVPASTPKRGVKNLLDTLMAMPENRQPKAREGFHVDEKVWRLLVRNFHRKTPTLLYGPSGCGKTETVRMLCERHNVPLTVIPMGAVTDPTEHLVGKAELEVTKNGVNTTTFEYADFALAIQKPGVVLLDEINRCPRNGNNILFSVLDGSRMLPAFGAKGIDKRFIPVHPECMFIATANIGSEYTGTDEMDEALKKRLLVRIKMDYMPYKTEADVLVKRTGISREDAENIALVAKDIRSYASEHRGDMGMGTVSTRETLTCAELVRDGFDPVEAMETAFLQNFDEDPDFSDAGQSPYNAVKGMIATRLKKKQKA